MIMGVLNLTPDSFSDGGKFNSLGKGINHAKKLLKEGVILLILEGSLLDLDLKQLIQYKNGIE